MKIKLDEHLDNFRVVTTLILGLGQSDVADKLWIVQDKAIHKDQTIASEGGGVK